MTAATEFDFDVAISFAGEDREYAEDLSERLSAAGFRVFIDSDFAAEMWGEDLVEFFDQIYRVKARYAIIFVSRFYGEKMWPRHERRSALARTVEQRSAYVLPIRLDDTRLDGLRPTVGYLDARRLGLDHIVDVAIQKLGGSATGANPVARVPRGEAELQQVLALKPPGWEFLYFAGQLKAQLDAAEPRYRDYAIGYALPDDHYGGSAVVDMAMAELRKLRRLVDNQNSVMTREVQERAFGAPGEPGDPEMLRHLATRWNDFYLGAMDWTSSIRGLIVPDDYEALMAALADFSGNIVDVYRDFVGEFVEQVDTVPARMQAGEPITIAMTLVISLPEEAASRFSAEVDRLRSRAGG